MIQTIQERIEADRRRRIAQEKLEHADDPACPDATKVYKQVKEIRIKQAKEHRRTSEKFNLADFETFTPAGRLATLVALSQRVIRVADYKELKRRRRAFDSIKNKKFPLTGVCWCCRESPPVHRHHVILLKNGGRVTSAKNLVMLCHKCHADIHPWMDKPAMPVSAARFVLDRAKVDAARILEEVAALKMDITLAEAHIVDLVRSVFNIL